MKIFIEEEYGYRYWIWTIEKTKSEMISWWSELETVIPFFYDPSKSLPFGDFEHLSEPPLDTQEDVHYIHLHEDCDSYMRLAGENYYHKGFSIE
jgi:hypothetical protein